MAPWKFNHPESVRWAVEYPAPLLYCIIQKKDGLVRVYQTMARFAVAVAAELPASMALVPGEPGSGRTYGFDGATGSHSLGSPILEFKVEDLLDDERFEQYRKVLRFWVLNDFDNVRRFQMGMRSVGWPGEHTTNEVPAGSNTKYSLIYAPPEIRAKAEETASELLEWLARVRLNNGDYLGTLLAALMLRHRDPDPQVGQFPWDVFSSLRGITKLEAATSTNRTDYVAAPFDKLLAELVEKVLPKADQGSGSSPRERR